jgi:hypothetical protein
MARFIPEVALEDIVHDSERLVYEALRGLPMGFVVLHSFPWLRPTRDLAGEPLREGEADFVILHPDRGLLVLEVKGGRPELSGRTWSRGGKDLRDPFDQARKSRYALLDAVRERTRKRVHARDVHPWRRGRVSPRQVTAPSLNRDPRVWSMRLPSMSCQRDRRRLQGVGAK